MVSLPCLYFILDPNSKYALHGTIDMPFFYSEEFGLDF